MQFADIVYWLVLETFVFWTATIALYALHHGTFDILGTKLAPESARRTRARNGAMEADEERTIRADLERNVRIQGLRAEAGNAHTSEQALLNLGVAVNHELARADALNEQDGDHWLGAARPVWLAAFQFIPALIISTPLCMLLQLPAGPVTACAFVAVTLVLGIAGAIVVREKVRAGINRLGAYRSFLHSGLQFIIPVLETVLPVALTNLVWGPGEETEESSRFHIPGSAAGDTNPSPGVFRVQLRGAYGVDIILKIVLRVRRSSPHDWYSFLYEYSSMAELGELIADVTQALLTTRAREVREAHQDQSRPEAEQIGDALREFLNQTPEITGDILLALYEVSRERIGGLMPISVSMAAVVPDETYRNLLVDLDTAKVARRTQQLEGEGAALRWTEAVQPLADMIQGLPDDIRPAVQQLVTSDVQQQFAKKASGVDQVVNALASQFTQSATQSQQQGV